jgi:DNA repair exonuclease SbcCD ATPase subunit
VPAEVIDPVFTAERIEQKKENILKEISSKTESIKELSVSEEKFERIAAFLSQFDISSYQKKKDQIDKKKDQLAELIKEMEIEAQSVTRNKQKQTLLSEVPCGTEYPSCKFIKDAYHAEDLIQVSESTIASCSRNINAAGDFINALEPEKVEEHIQKYNILVDKRNTLATSIATNKLRIEKAESNLFKEQVELEQLQNKSIEYEQNKEAIENLKGLIRSRNEKRSEVKSVEKKIEDCQLSVMQMHKAHGSLEQRLLYIEDQKTEYETLQSDFAAYHLLMTCCHPNGVSYDIIKRRLPFINQEIAKILTNIVEFEVFITNNEDKLDIFIKHARHDARPLEMGSGAEKTIASMAIRLAFLTVSNLPKSDLFILDEPGTALDEENMEGFVRILDMIKGYFKTVLLISHLDGLKDCVDIQINIERKDGFAHVNT